MADIYQPGKPACREYSVFFHDELEILDKNGNPPADHRTGLPSSTTHGGIKETHVFHLHNHQWRLEPENPVSTIIDSITISPQECYTLDILYGAGSLNRVIGDVIFHCHLYPHFHEGMWTLW